MDMKLTEEQRRAIELTGRDVCLSAGAGSGKTFVLVRRYFRLIETGKADVHNIVAITFTEKAAKEMKDRIREACEERVALCLKEGDRSGVGKWEKVKGQLDSAQIGTIHGFCARLLRENPLEAGVDPGFQIMDEVQSSIFLSKIVHRYVMRLVDDGEKGILLLVQEYGWRRLEQILCSLLERREELDEAFGADRGGRKGDVLQRRRELVEKVRYSAFRELLVDRAWRDAVETLKKGGSTSPDDELETRRLKLLSLAGGLRERCDLEEACGILDEIKRYCRRVRTRAVGWEPSSKAEVEFALSSMGELVKQYSSLINEPDKAFEKSEAELYFALLERYVDLGKEYSAAKAEKGLLDFEDLLIGVRDMLLSSPALLKRLNKNLRYTMVDEFQDTNDLQKQIIYLICRGKRGCRSGGELFVVGDEKQSIYRFRGADVSVFSKTRDEIVKTGGVELELSSNFRSQPSGVHYFNDFFVSSMNDFPGRRSYEPVYRRIRPTRPDHGREPVVELLLVKGQKGELSSDLRRREADAIARWIEDAVEGKRKLVYESRGGRESGRSLRYGDVAILFRAMTDVKIYERALQEQGIPYHLVAGSGFFGKQEVLDLINFLRYLDNSNDEIALVGVLRSPFFGVSDETLYWLSRKKRVASFFGKSRIPWPRPVLAAEKQKLTFAHEVFDELNQVKDRLTLAELISAVLRKTGYPAVLATTFMGPQKISNLLKLTDVARDLGRSGLFALSDFILYVDELMSSDIREGEAQVETEAGDVVRLMTVHKAKGLQFPVVIVPDMGRRLVHPQQPVVLWDRHWGVGLKVKTFEGGFRGGLLYDWLVREEKRREIAEAKRVFYVVNTRAMDYLLLSSSVGKRMANQSWLKWLQQIYGQRLDRVEELPASLFQHGDGREVRVTVVSSNGGDSVLKRREHRPPPATGRGVKDGVPSKVIWERTGALKLPPAAGLRDLTVTQLEQYRDCPRRFLLRYVEGIPEPPVYEMRKRQPLVGAGQLGELVHSLLSRWNFERSVAQQWKNVELAVTEFSPLLDDSGRKELAAEVRKILGTFVDSELYREMLESGRIDSGRLLRERSFFLKVGPAVVRGKIDLLFQTAEGGWKLVDYKTERIKAGQIKGAGNHYRFQMGLYAMAVRDILGFDLADIVVVFLRPGKFHSIEPKEHLFSWARAETETIIKGISDGDFRAIKESCSACPYGKVCGGIK